MDLQREEQRRPESLSQELPPGGLCLEDSPPLESKSYPGLSGNKTELLQPLHPFNGSHVLE